LREYIEFWVNAGIHSDMDDDERRKVFLTNAMSLFLAVVMILVFFNDVFNTENYLAACRRTAVLALMPMIPFLNAKGLSKLSKSIFLFFPGFILLGVPIFIGDFYPGQFIWFQYAGAIFCSIPVILFNQDKERIYIAFFFIFYLAITLFSLLLAFFGITELILDMKGA